jgi:hypothetical protein
VLLDSSCRNTGGVASPGDLKGRCTTGDGTKAPNPVYIGAGGKSPVEAQTSSRDSLSRGCGGLCILGTSRLRPCGSAKLLQFLMRCRRTWRILRFCFLSPDWTGRMVLAYTSLRHLRANQHAYWKLRLTVRADPCSTASVSSSFHPLTGIPAACPGVCPRPQRGASSGQPWRLGHDHQILRHASHRDSIRPRFYAT